MQKTRQLPITDLARIATLHPSERLHQLKQVKSGGGFGSYEPTRRKLPDIVNRHPGAFESKRAGWSQIESDIARMSKSDHEERMNKTAARSIFDYCVAHGVEARELDGFPLSFGIGVKLRCWSPALFVYPDRITIPFFDMRRTYRLSRDAVRFMFSVMHIALRENNPDYAEVQSEVLRLKDEPERNIRVISDQRMRLFTYDELEQMVTETYQLWHAVLDERAAKAAKANDDWSEDQLFAQRKG